jgi:hypothetical protein
MVDDAAKLGISGVEIEVELLLLFNSVLTPAFQGYIKHH